MANPFIFQPLKFCSSSGGVSPSAGNGSAGENRGGAVGLLAISGISKAMFEYQVALQSTGSFTRME